MGNLGSVGLRTALSACLLCLPGCFGKSMTRPYSEMRGELERDGLPALTPEESRAQFQSYERAQLERLKKLIRARAESGVVDSDYRVGKGDQIAINVFDVPELNLTAHVNETGSLSLPLVGGLKAAGLTEPQLRSELTRALATYVKNPQVTIAISGYGSQKVAVMGAVERPGTYPLKKGSNSIIELLGEAGGPNQRAGSYVNFVPAEFTGISGTNEASARAQFALAALQLDDPAKKGIEIYFDQIMGTNGGIPLDVPVRGGDMIVVPEAGKITVDGEVEKRGAYELGSRMTLMSALGAAGGITYGAKVDEIEIIRDVGPASERLRLIVNLEAMATGKDRDVYLRNGDIVRVPSDSGRRMTQDTFDNIAKFINFGIGGSVPLR